MKRIVKNALAVKDKALSWANTRVEATVSDAAAGEVSVPGRFRRFYTNTYKSLDQFDQTWYEVAYDKRDRDWQTCYKRAVILDCVINARSVYCEAKQVKEPSKDFVRQLISDIRSDVQKMKEQ